MLVMGGAYTQEREGVSRKLVDLPDAARVGYRAGHPQSTFTAL